MKNRHQLEEEINRLTSEMRDNYPEMYKLLNETPLFSNPGAKLSDTDLENYLLTLRDQLKEQTPKEE
jgi:hypothetical protein